MVALGKPDLDDADWFGPLIRARLVDLLAADIIEAVRAWKPGAVVLEASSPYGRFLAEAAAEIWKELAI